MLTISKCSREQSSTTTTNAATTNDSTAEATAGCPSSYAGPAVQRTTSYWHAKRHESDGAI